MKLKNLPFPPEILNQHVIALGKTGAGKSSALRVLVESLLDAEQPFCGIDPKGDWWGLKSSADGKRAGYPIVIFGGEHGDVPINAHSGAHIAELVATGNRPCIIDLGGWMVAERTRFFIDFASTLFRHSRGKRWLMIDEVHNFAPQGKVIDPQAGQMLHWANRLASEGRGKGIQILAASQRPQKVHKDFVTSCETLIAMRVIHVLDRGAMKDWIDGCGDPKKGADVIGSLAQMPRGTGWVWSPEIGFGPRQVTFPMFRTYDSFSPQEGKHSKLKGWAEVNLEEVSATLAGVVKEAAANDPKLLRARISTLEAQVKSERDQPPVAAAELQAAENRGRADAKAGLERLGHELSAVNSDLAKALGMVQATSSKLASLQMQVYGVARDLPARQTAVLPTPKAPAPQPQRAPVAAAVERNPSAVTGPQQRILDSLAWLASIRPTDPADRTQLALLAGATPKSSAYANNLGALRTASLITYPGGNTVKLTDAGHAAAQQPASAPTTEDLHRTLQSKLAAPQWRILEILARRHPDVVERGDLAGHAGASATSSAFANNLGALRSMGFIDYQQGGVVARDCLFIR